MNYAQHISQDRVAILASSGYHEQQQLIIIIADIINT
jgi:hypothetical protein